MPAPDSSSRFVPGNPVVYRISVAGSLAPSLSGRLGDMSIESSETGGDERSSVTTLVGPLIDQAQLAGVLSALFERRLHLLSVEALLDDSSTGTKIET